VLPIVSGLLAHHPALAIRLMLSDRYVHLVDEAVDVAVRIGALADSRLIAVKLGAVSAIAVASPAYLARRGTPRTPAELAGHDLIGFDAFTTGHDWRFADREAVHVEPRLLVNSADAAITAAEDGLGITRALSYQVRAAVYAGRLVPVLAGHAPPALPVHAIYPARRFASANVTAFVAAARARFAAEPVVAIEDWQVPAPPRKKPRAPA
jgi:DNA-binding transcriptional LysR family regulator